MALRRCSLLALSCDAFAGSCRLLDPGFRREVDVSDDVTDDMSAEFRERALLVVPLRGQVQERQNEPRALCGHGPLHDPGKEPAEEVLDVLAGINHGLGLLLLAENRPVS